MSAGGKEGLAVAIAVAHVERREREKGEKNKKNNN
jgi:hypothetical protein